MGRIWRSDRPENAFGKLVPEEQTIVKHHPAECSHCRKVVEIMIKSQSEVPSPIQPNSNKKS
jgi:hypothetical protein